MAERASLSRSEGGLGMTWQLRVESLSVVSRRLFTPNIAFWSLENIRDFSLALIQDHAHKALRKL